MEPPPHMKDALIPAAAPYPWVLSAEHVLNPPNAFEVAWVYFSFTKINGFVIKFLHCPCLMVTLTSANVWQENEFETKHAAFGSASNFAVRQANPSCQRNVSINLLVTPLPTPAAGPGHFLAPPRPSPACSFPNMHPHAHTHMHTQVS